MRQIDSGESSELSALGAELRSKGLDNVVNRIVTLNKEKYVKPKGKFSDSEFFGVCAIAYFLVAMPSVLSSQENRADPILEFLRQYHMLGNPNIAKIKKWPKMARLIAAKISSGYLQDLSSSQKQIKFADYLQLVLEGVGEIVDWLKLNTYVFRYVDKDSNENIGMSNKNEQSFPKKESYLDLIEELLLSDASSVTESDKIWLLTLPKIVYISPGSYAEAFHASPECKWLRIGRGKAAGVGGSLGEVRSMPRAETLRPIAGINPRRPCEYCLENAGKIPYNEEPVKEIQQAQVTKFAGDILSTEVNIGDEIEIIDGYFATLVGVVGQIDFSTRKITALVEIFGRETQIEVDFSHFRVTPKQRS